MSNKALIIIVAVVLVLFLAFPVVMTFGRAAMPAKKVAIPDLPPLLNADNLPGTMWVVEPQPGIKVNITLNAGGQAVAIATNPIVKKLAGTDMLAGSWSVNGPTLTVSTEFKGKKYTTDLVIAGDKIYAKEGLPIIRVK